jgi:outer membrane protein assembly factor BamE (lipoprotein component of BamABCDE complex)
MRPLTLALLLALFLGLSACATVGRPFDTRHTSDVQPGQDQAQIRAWFGTPWRIQNLTDHPTGCTTRWNYTYAHSTAGIHTTTEVLIVDFDAEGKVCAHGFHRLEN